MNIYKGNQENICYICRKSKENTAHIWYDREGMDMSPGKHICICADCAEIILKTANGEDLVTRDLTPPEK